MIGGIGLVLGLLGLGGLAVKSAVKNVASKPIKINSVSDKKEWDMRLQMSLQMSWISKLETIAFPTNPFYSCGPWKPEEILESGRYIMYDDSLILLKEVLPQPYYDMYKYYGIGFGLPYNDKFALALAQMQMLRDGYEPIKYFYELTPIEPFIEKLVKENPQTKLDEKMKSITVETELNRYFYMPDLSPFTPECMAECCNSLGGGYIALSSLDYAFLKWKMIQPPTYGIDDPKKRYRYGVYRRGVKKTNLLREATVEAYMNKDRFWLRPEHLKPEYRAMYDRLIPKEPLKLDFSE